MIITEQRRENEVHHYWDGRPRMFSLHTELFTACLNSIWLQVWVAESGWVAPTTVKRKKYIFQRNVGSKLVLSWDGRITLSLSSCISLLSVSLSTLTPALFSLSPPPLSPYPLPPCSSLSLPPPPTFFLYLSSLSMSLSYFSPLPENILIMQQSLNWGAPPGFFF